MSTEPTAEQIVATPAVEDDLTADVRRAARPMSKPTMALAGVTAAVVVFAGGAWTHAAFGSSSSPGGRDPAPSAPARAGYGGYGGGGAAATPETTARSATGTIERIDGDKITLRTAQGGEITVSTSDSTRVSVNQGGKLGDLKPGASVVVQVQQGDDGTLTTPSITRQAAR